jgi:hypothetical protein
VIGIDISVDKEELLQALASAAGCDSAEVQERSAHVEAASGPRGSSARKLARGKVALGWSKAKAIAIPTRPLQCYKCLELGHVRAACVFAVDRGHLCSRCGGSEHCARRDPAATPKCPLCESLEAPAGHRMGGAECTPPQDQEEASHPRVDLRRGNETEEHRRSSCRGPGGRPWI